MRTFKLIFIALTFALGLGGCTTNNGDIGDWFGTWRLIDITIDGTTDTAYEGNVFWQFQTDVVNMLEVYPQHVSKFHWGTWSESGKVLTLDYDHTPAPDTTPESEFLPPVSTYLPGGIMRLSIDKFTATRLTVTYTDPDTSTAYTYHLRKQ
ncbi:MAG: lipocalin-like domain-containing protein [Muribaculaceae bacterium]|nr:lipocalin-like domain-containing protein [Muribaculaceae bacterium]